MSDSIKVAIKVRPLIKREKDEELPIQWTIQGNSIAPLDPELRKRGDGFYFDHIFDMDQTNDDVFNIVAKPIVEGAVKGFNGTIFAYGQTSSGKTYTMMGESDCPGVIPLAVDYIFDMIANTCGREFLLRVSYIEIYNERINDLLDKNSVDLKIKEVPKSGQAIVMCKEEVINCPETVLAIMKKGEKNRRTGETNMNERSSRSHTIFRITIESRESNSDGAVHVSQLNLVDLAGSERAAQTGATGERFNEGRHINLSLSSLGLVIMQLSEDNPQKYVNFRDSKLTRILQSSLGGNAMTTIICAVTPAALEETQCTLAFASRAKRIKNKPQVNEVLSDAALLKRYAKQLAKLKDELEKAKSADVVEMESKLIEKDRANQLLEERIELLKTRIVCGSSTPDKDQFIRRAKRRRTWGGAGTQTKIIPLQLPPGLPTIKEMEKTPEKMTAKERIKRRQSIIQSLDIANQTFQTEFTDFELELIESERARVRLSDSSTAGDESCTVTIRPQRNVKFMDEIAVYDASFKSIEITPERKTREEDSMESPGTPKSVLRCRMNYLMDSYDALIKDHRSLEEFTKLEKQLFVEEAVEKAMIERDETIATLRQSLTESEQTRREIVEKYTTLQSHSSETAKRLAEVEQKLAESENSLRTLRSENTILAEKLGKLNESNTCNTNEQIMTDKMIEEDTSSMFANNTYFEDMSVSGTPFDSIMTNDIENVANVSCCETNISNDNTIVSKGEETKRSKEITNAAYSDFMRQISEKSSEELARVMQELISVKLSLENENMRLEATLGQKIREADEVKNDIRELKSGIEKLQETIHLLTNENTDLASKLTNEKDQPSGSEKCLRSTIDELNLSIRAIVDEKIMLDNSVKQVDEQVNLLPPSNATNEEEMRKTINEYKELIDSLTMENHELSTNLMNKIEELDHLRDERTLSGDHECTCHELINDLSVRNKHLQNENIELSNNLMDKIEENDRLKAEYESLQSQFSSIPHKPSENLIEMSMNCTNLVDSEISQNVELYRAPLTTNEQAEKRTESFTKSEELKFTNPTVDDLLRLSMIPGEKLDDEKGRTNDESAEAWRSKAEMLHAQVEHLTLLNEKLSDLKLTSCKQCARLVELRDNRKTLKNEVKALTRTLQDLQTKFDRECADTEILRTKASEDVNLSVCDSTLNGSITFEGGVNISFVEERVQSLHDELEAMRANHDKLSALYKEKCEEIERLQDSSVRETTPTPLSTDSPKPRRNDEKLERIKTDIEALQKDLRHFKKSITSVSAALQKFVNEKMSMQSEIELLKNEKQAYEERLEKVYNSSLQQEQIKSLEKEVTRLSSEVERSNHLTQELEEAKSSLETQVQLLKTEKDAIEQRSTQTEVSSMAQKKIEMLESEVARCIVEIEKHNVVNRQLEDAKVLLENEVQSLKTAKEDVEEKSSESNDFSVTQENMKSLENEVARLSAEMDNSNRAKSQLETVKSSLEAEVQLLKTENEELTKKLSESEDLALAQQRIESLETEIGRLNAEIDNSNAVRKQLEDAKSSLQAEVQSLQIEKAEFEKISLESKELSTALETIQSLENKVACLKTEIQNSYIVKSQLAEAKLALETEVHLLKNNNEACEEKLSESGDLLVFKQKITSLEMEVSRLGSEVQNLNITKCQLEDAKLSLEERIQSLQTENEALTQKLSVTETSSAAQERIESMENELARLRSDLEDFNAVKQQLDDATLLLENEVDLLKAKRNIDDETIEELHRSLQNQDNDNETCKVTLEKLNSQKESIVANSSISCNDVNRSNGNLESYENIVALLRSKLTEAISEGQKYIEINAELNNRLAQMQITKSTAERWSLEQELTTTEVERLNMQALTESAKCVLEDSSTNANEYTKEITQFINKIKELERIEEESKNEKLALRNEITSLQAEVGNLRDYLNKARDRVCEVENKNSSFTTEHETSKSAKITLTGAEFDELPHKTLKEYEKMVKELQDKLQSITKELKSNAKQTIDLDNELTRLNTAKEELNDKRFALQTEVEDLRKQKSELHEALTNLRDTASELEKKNDLLVAELAAIDAKKEKLVSSEISDNGDSQCHDKYLEELESARKSITKELMSLKPASDSAELAKKSISELFVYFVKTIMAKEQEVMNGLCKRFENEKQKLVENNKQSKDVEKRVSTWAKELESDLEITQQDLSLEKARNAELSEKIQKLENFLKESSHENQMLNAKMKVLEVDFNTLQADLEKAPKVRQDTELNTVQEKERFIRDTADTREMELSAKLRRTEKEYKVKLEEITSELESHKSRNIELSHNLEGLEANEKQLKNIVDMKTTELAKCNNALEILKKELDVMTKSYNQSSRYNTDKDRQIEEITCLLKVRCDKLSEYKTKLEFIMPEYENLKDQTNERNLRLEKYKSEIECLTTENEKNISALKDQLDSEVIKTACYRKQLAEQVNKNTSLQIELVELRKKCEELEISNAKLAKSMRNSTSKLRAEEDLEDLRDANRTLQRNLDGAGNRINELQDMKTRLMNDLADLRVKYETTCSENEEMKSVLSSHRSSVADTIELREKYEILLQEKNRIALELEDKKSQLTQMQKRIEACEIEKEKLIEKNKELDTEMDDIVEHINELKKENAELDDKLYEMSKKFADPESGKISDQVVKIASLEKLVNKYEREITDLKSKLEKLLGEHEILAKTSKSLAIENTELRAKLSYLDCGDTLSRTDSSRSSSPALESLQMDNKRRRSRNDLFNINRPLHTFENNEGMENCRCEALTQHISKIEKELALKNGKIATLELEMQSEIFPHMAKCKDLEELLAVSTKKAKLLKAKIKELEEARAVEMSIECEKCRQWKKNRRDQASQCIPQSAPLSMSGMSSGVIEQHVQMKKFEKEKAALKDIVRKRHQKIVELKSYIKELERRLGDNENSAITDSSDQPMNSKLESASNPREAMKENIPAIWDNQRQPSLSRRNWFN